MFKELLLTTTESEILTDLHELEVLNYKEELRIHNRNKKKFLEDIKFFKTEILNIESVLGTQLYKYRNKRNLVLFDSESLSTMICIIQRRLSTNQYCLDEDEKDLDNRNYLLIQNSLLERILKKIYDLGLTTFCKENFLQHKY